MADKLDLIYSELKTFRVETRKGFETINGRVRWLENKYHGIIAVGGFVIIITGVWKAFF